MLDQDCFWFIYVWNLLELRNKEKKRHVSALPMLQHNYLDINSWHFDDLKVKHFMSIDTNFGELKDMKKSIWKKL